MLCRATQDRQVIAESSEKTQSTGGGNGKPLQYTCCENLMNCIKGKFGLGEQSEAGQRLTEFCKKKKKKKKLHES